jgi:hypothetical protein
METVGCNGDNYRLVKEKEQKNMELDLLIIQIDCVEKTLKKIHRDNNNFIKDLLFIKADKLDESEQNTFKTLGVLYKKLNEIYYEKI